MENGTEQPSGLLVSYEAVYTALSALPRGELVGMTHIKERPEEIEGRFVPGH